MEYWIVVEIVYILDTLIFGYLAYFFIKTLRREGGESGIVTKMMAILTTALFLQELYFGINTATDPNKLEIFSGMFPIVSPFWIYAKIILTIAGMTIIYTLLKIKKEIG